METLTQTHTPATERQLIQVTRMATDVVEKTIREFGLDKEGIQHVHSRGDELTKSVRKNLVKKLRELSVPSEFQDEEVYSSWGYPLVEKPKSINEQINDLIRLFPGLSFSEQEILECGKKIGSGLSRTSREDGWVWSAIPNWRKRSDIFGGSYVEAIEKVFDVIRKTFNGGFENRCAYFIDFHFRQLKHTMRSWERISETQGNADILIVPIQLGIRHRGRSVRRARVVFSSNEFGLGAFASSIMILTRREHYRNTKTLWIDCAGDEARKPCDYGNDFDNTPFLYFHDNKVKFDVRLHSVPNERYGSASVLVLQP